MKLVRLTDEQATELGIRHLDKRSFWVNDWCGYYDARRVKRAQRLARRHGFTKWGWI